MKRTLFAAVAAGALTAPAYADLPSDAVHEILHTLNRAKPGAFHEAQGCITNIKHYETVRFCTVKALQANEDPPPNYSTKQFLASFIAQAEARASMAACLYIEASKSDPPLQQTTWDYCLNNAPGVPFPVQDTK